MKYIIGLLIVLSVMAAQELPKVAVFGFSSVGVDEASAKTATSIFRTEIANSGKYAVVEADVIKTAIGNDDPVDGISSAIEKAKTLKVSKAVIGSLSKLGEQTLIEVRLIDVNSGIVEFSDRLGSITGTDIDVILSRLAKGVAEQKKSEATAEVGNIIKKEAEEPNRRASFITGSTRVGYLFPIGGFGENPGIPLGLIGSVNYETDKFMAEMSYSYYGIGGHAGLWSIDFSGFKLMSKTDICPFIGGGLGISHASAAMLQEYNYNSYHYSYYTEYSGTGPVLNLGGGIIFMRTYDFRFITDFRYHISFCDIHGGYWDYEYPYTYHEREISKVQNSFSINIGMMYRRSKGGGCCLFF